jgi:quercetin dioxygenase-like cupin family protein
MGEDENRQMENGTEEIKIGELAIRFLLEGKDTGGALAMFEFDVAAGGKVPAAHSHDAYEETAYGLQGVMTFTVDGKRKEIRQGEVLSIPRGAIHRFDNFESETAKCLAVLTPGLLGPEYFREVAAVLKASAGGPPNLASIGEVMRRHGLTPAR